jgi:hypothetical protein
VAEIPTADWSWINAAADRFERACERGRRPRIEDFLLDERQERVPAILDELLRVECELRRRGGEVPTAEEYRMRFPDHGAVVDAVFGASLPDLARSEVGDPRREGQAYSSPAELSAESRSVLSTAADSSSPAAGADIRGGTPTSKKDSFE